MDLSLPRFGLLAYPAYQEETCTQCALGRDYESDGEGNTVVNLCGDEVPKNTGKSDQRQIRRKHRPLCLLIGALTLFVITVGPWWRGWIDTEASYELNARAGQALVAATEQLPVPLTASSLRVGVATVDLTDLTPGIPLAGYAHRVWKPNTGVADPLSVRALVLDNGQQRVAVIAADLLLVNRNLANAVHAKLQTADSPWLRQELFFSATHTHSSLGGYANNLTETLGLGWFRPALADRIAERMAEAVRSASVALQPAEFAGVSVQVAPEFVRNRTVEGGSANRWLDVLVFRKPGSVAPLTVVAVFGAHATCRSSHDLRVSADYPGVFRQCLESKLGGTCLFLAGAMGSMAPPSHIIARERLPGWLGEQLANAAAGAIHDLDGFRSEIELVSVGLEIPMPQMAVKLSRNWRLSPVFANRLIPSSAWVQGLRVGDRLLLGTPADYGGTLAEDLRTTVPETVAVVTSFAGDYVGYVLPDDYYDLPKYEPRHMAFYGPHLGSYFQETLAGLAGRLCAEP